MAQTDERTKVAELIKGIRIAMLTTTANDGSLVSHPMTTRDVEFDGTVWFVSKRSFGQVRNIEARPQVNVAFVTDSTWVSLSGAASVVDDVATLTELWSAFTDSWLEGGPDNPDNILIRVDAQSAQYWDSPGTKITQVANLVKTKITGDRIEGDSGTVQM